MKEKKLQVFVSSTFTDLRNERQAAVEAILSSGNIPAGMELFIAGDETQITVIKRWIEESDIYLLILGGRYGSVDKKTGKSYTQLEYEYASSLKKPMFSLVISEFGLDEKVKVLGRSAIEELNNRELKKFKSGVLTKLVKFWDDKKDIKIAIHETLAEFSHRDDLIGWIRGDKSVNTGFLAEEIARVAKENSELRDKIKSVEVKTATESQIELKFVVPLKRRNEINQIVKKIQGLEGVVNVEQTETMTGRRYLEVVLSPDADRDNVITKIDGLLN